LEVFFVSFLSVTSDLSATAFLAGAFLTVSLDVGDLAFIGLEGKEQR
jgi:hypothetical protein